MPEETIIEKPLSLQESVTQALDAAIENKTETTVEVKTEAAKSPVASSNKTEQESESVHEVDASPDEIKSALSIQRALNDPLRRDAAIKWLVENSGLKVETKAQEKKLIRDAKTILKEKLGDAYELYSGDKLAEAFEELVESKTSELTKPIQDKFQEQERTTQERQANDAMETLWNETGVTDKVERERISGLMVAKMANLTPGAGSTAKDYLKDLYNLVTIGQEVKTEKKDDKKTQVNKEVKRVVDRIKNNAKDVKSSGDGGADDERLVPRNPKYPSLRDSVEAGMKGQRFE